MEQQISNKRKPDNNIQSSHQQESPGKECEGTTAEKKPRLDVSSCALTLKPAKYEHLRKITKMCHQKLFNTKPSPDKQDSRNESVKGAASQKDKKQELKCEGSPEPKHVPVNSTNKASEKIVCSSNSSTPGHSPVPRGFEALSSPVKVDQVTLSESNRCLRTVNGKGLVCGNTTSPGNHQNTMKKQEMCREEECVIIEHKTDNLSTTTDTKKASLQDKETKPKQLLKQKIDSDQPQSPVYPPVEADININRYNTREFTKMLRTMIEERMSRMEQEQLSSSVSVELNAKISLLEKMNKTLETRSIKAKSELDKALNALKLYEQEKPKMITRGTQTVIVAKLQIPSSTPSIVNQLMKVQPRNNPPVTVFSHVQQQQFIQIQRPTAPNKPTYLHPRSQNVLAPRVSSPNSFGAITVNKALRPKPQGLVVQSLGPRPDAPRSSMGPRPDVPGPSVGPRPDAPASSVQVVYTSRPSVMSHTPHNINHIPQNQVAHHPPRVFVQQSNHQTVTNNHSAQQTAQGFVGASSPVRGGPPNTRVIPSNLVTRPYHPRESSFILTPSGQLAQRHLPQNAPQNAPQQSPQYSQVSVIPRNIPQAQVQPVQVVNSSQDMSKPSTNMGRPPPVTVTVRPQQHYNQAVTQQPLRPPPPYIESSQRVLVSGSAVQQIQTVTNHNQRPVVHAGSGQLQAGPGLVSNQINNASYPPPPSLRSTPPSNTQTSMTSKPSHPTVNQAGQVVGTVVPQIQTRSQQTTEQSSLNEQTRNVPPPPLPQPASFPQTNNSVGPKPIEPQKTPPKPSVSIAIVQTGIVLSWNMKLDNTHAKVDIYQLFAYQDTSAQPTSPAMWKKIGVVKALPLPMACTLTQFLPGSTYHFAVRAVDVNGRAGSFSDPCTITLPKKT